MHWTTWVSTLLLVTVGVTPFVARHAFAAGPLLKAPYIGSVDDQASHRAFQVGDIDGDGFKDVATIQGMLGFQAVPRRLAWWQGDGTGLYRVNRTDTGLASNYVVAAMALGDITRDGLSDLEVVSVANNVWVLSSMQSVATGGFGVNHLTLAYAVSTGGTAMAVDDIDGDGYEDVAVLRTPGGVMVHWGSPSSLGPGYSVGTLARPASIVLADFDEDGRPDIAVTNPDPVAFPPAPYAGLEVKRITPSYTVETLYTLNTLPFSPVLLVAADFDQDGHQDLATAGGPTVLVVRGNGDGTFQPPWTTTLPFGVASMYAGPMDDDTRPDLAVRGGGGLYGLHSLGDGTFAAPQAKTLGGPAFHLSGFADLDGDGTPDALGNSSTVSGVLVSPGQGNGRYGAGASLDSPTPFAARDLRVDDFDGDGIPDVALSPQSGDAVAVLRGVDGGSFTSWFSGYVGPTSEKRLAVGDLNLDGRPDLAVAGGNTVSTLVQDGAGGWSLDENARPTAQTQVALGDLDLDGDPDVSTWSPGVNDVYVNGGLGAIDHLQTYSAPSTSQALVPADYDSDGDTDLQFIHVQNLSYSRCVGDGTLEPNTMYLPPTGGLNEAVAFDVNHDTRPELVVATGLETGGAIVLTSSLSQPLRFATLKTSIAMGRNSRLVVGNLDNDAFEEVVAIELAGNELMVARGLGAYKFDAPSAYGMSKPVKDVAIADVDGNGWNDVLVAYQAGGVGVLFNTQGLPLDAGPRTPVAVTAGRVRIAPNPTLGAFEATFSLPTAAAARVRLVDLSGRTVSHHDLPTGASGIRTIRLVPQKSLTPGIYWVLVEQNGVVARSRISVLR